MGSPRRSLRSSLAVLLVAGMLAGCGDDATTSSAKDAEGCVRGYDANTDYFPVKQTLKHAKNLTLSYAKNYQVLTVRQPSPGAGPRTYVLVRCGTPTPRLSGPLAGATTVQTPVKSIFSASTTHLPFITGLGLLPRLTGVASAALITSPEVNARVKAGAIAEFSRGQEIDTEKVIAAGPDVLITDGTEAKDYGPLRDAGITILADAEWLEPTALGRAEWVKFFAALSGTETRAGRQFDEIETAYTGLAGKAKTASVVKVLPGTMYQGRWSMPNGGSYVAGLIRDAGGTYPWASTTGTGGSALDLEAVLSKSRDARVWLVDENTWKTLADAEKADPRYAEFGAYTSGNVWSANKVLGPGGGNDFYERGVARPDLVLGDLIAILHPRLSPGHEFTFYRRLTR